MLATASLRAIVSANTIRTTTRRNPNPAAVCNLLLGRDKTQATSNPTASAMLELMVRKVGLSKGYGSTAVKPTPRQPRFKA